MERVSTQSMHTHTVTDMSRLQSSLAKTQEQISSGVKTDSFIELGTEINRVQDLQASVSSAVRYKSANTVALSRLNSMDLATSQIQDVASDLSSALATENSASGNVFDLAGFARTALSKIQGALNTTQAGRALFAGSKTDQAAVGDLNVVNNVSNGVANADYYRGDSFSASVQASDTLNLDYGINAGDPAFQNIIGALHKAIELDGSGDESARRQADAMLQTAITGLASVRTSINNNIVALNDVNTQHDRAQTQLNDALSKAFGTDVVGASIQSSMDQATLTATMQLFARISSLSLVNFLK